MSVVRVHIAEMKMFLLFLGFGTHYMLVAQDRYAVVIHEVMADPSPVVGLTQHEWIELRNISNDPVNLFQWRIGDGNGLSSPMPSFILHPDSVLILCPSNAVASLQGFGAVMSTGNFPSLDNDGEQLYLLSAGGKTIHAIQYETGWYKNQLKSMGGWTLEMIDAKNPCTGSQNWSASVANAGGTPGKHNSIAAVNPDIHAPALQNLYAVDSMNLMLVFSESLDSLHASLNSNYSIDRGLMVLSASCIGPLFNQVLLRISAPLLHREIYSVKVSGVQDCKANPIGPSSSLRVGLPEEPGQNEWVINEILFDPRSYGFDYVEFYNNSNKILDLSTLHIAGRNSAGAITHIEPLAKTPVYVFPGEYIVATEQPESLSVTYQVSNPGAVHDVSLPSFPDDEGIVVLLNGAGLITDELHYYDDWHFKLIANREGIALERLSPDGKTNDPHNWHSASSMSGYGTPGIKNSQSLNPGIETGVITIPRVFSPDNDGRDDVALIQYKMPDAGYVCNTTIFDISGRAVRRLIKSGLLGLNGSCVWDGLDDNGNRLPIGVYIIYSDLFNLNGERKQLKNVIVLTRKLWP